MQEIIQGAAGEGGLIVKGETSAKVILSNAYGSSSSINPIVLMGPALQDGTITEGDTKDKTVTIHFNDDTIYVGNEKRYRSLAISRHDKYLYVCGCFEYD